MLPRRSGRSVSCWAEPDKGRGRNVVEGAGMRILLLLLLTTVALAAPPAVSKDGRFTMALPEEYQTLDNPNPSSMLNLLCPTAKALVVVVRAKPEKKTPAQLIKIMPNEVPWKIASSKVGKVGNRPAAIFQASEVMKEYPNFKTVVGIVPASKGLYIFQIHYSQGEPAVYEKWLSGVTWK